MIEESGVIQESVWYWTTWITVVETTQIVRQLERRFYDTYIPILLLLEFK